MGEQRSGPLPLSVPSALADIAWRFDQVIENRGASSSGVGWSSPQAQSLRFQALLRIFDPACGIPDTASVLDLGCGYGALWAELAALPHPRITSYVGYDISASMIAQAQRCTDDARTRFVRSGVPQENADYGFVSGTFNYRAKADPEDWKSYLRSMFALLARRCRWGLAINLLHSPRRRLSAQGSATMFYADIDEWTRVAKSVCKGGSVEVLTDYLDDDFTLLIRFPPPPETGRVPDTTRLRG